LSKVWYCRNCGYEVGSRGRCHACKEKLTLSALAELPVGPEDDEVGYRIDGWGGAERGELIVRLNDLGIPHRFEGEELVVEASDESRVDDLVAVLGDLLRPRRLLATAPGGPEDPDDGDAGGESLDSEDSAESPDGEDSDAGDSDGEDSDGEDSDGEGLAQPAEEDSPTLKAAVELLSDAVARLSEDPTDMQADADVAEASASVFTVERYGRFDEQEWAAVGRVTRQLLALLGAEEALDEAISTQAAVLGRLLNKPGANAAQPGEEAEAEATDVPDDDPSKAGGTTRSERTVYELPDWLPDQRAELEVRLSASGIDFEWDGDDLLVPAEREDDVDSVFDGIVGAGGDDDSDEERYRALTELFASTGRLAADPADADRQETVRDWAAIVGGSPLLGMDEIDWFRIMSKLRTLLGVLDGDGDVDALGDLAQEMHELLRTVV
jgi:hypothetical protein